MDFFVHGDNDVGPVFTNFRGSESEGDLNNLLSSDEDFRFLLEVLCEQFNNINNIIITYFKVNFDLYRVFERILEMNH